MRVLYIDCDSLRPDHLGCYGYDRATSPHIDRIASEGYRFTNCYVSDAPCLPSRTAFFTGRFGIQTGVVNHSGITADIRHRGRSREVSTEDAYRTLPMALSGAGYHTALVSPFPTRHGAWHVLDGFEEWYDTGRGGRERADEIHPPAEKWLQSHATEEDWYLHVNFWDPHTPYDTPLEYGTPFEDEPIPEWPTAEVIAEQYESYGPHSAHDLHHGYLTGEGPDDLERTPDEIASREDFGEWIDAYDTGIRFMDEYIGKLFDLLEEQGVFEETLIVVSADHGESQGELNVYGDHQAADAATCRVPLIVRGPDVESDINNGLHYHLDFAPTLAELTGIDVPSGWDGRSFARSITDSADTGRAFLVTGQGAWACQRGVRWDDWLLLRTYHDGWKDFDAVALYDLADDPHETEDLSDEHPEVVADGTTLLQQWHSQRQLDSAVGRHGGLPDAPRGLLDPLFEVIQEGGPAYLRGNADTYTTRLRETGREAHAETIERRGGVIEQHD